MLVPISASFYFKLACIPASALGCAPGSPVADFDGCSACPAKQCLGRLALSDPKLKEVKPLKVWISWEEDAWFDTDPVTCSTACAGCASLGDWSGEAGGAARAGAECRCCPALHAAPAAPWSHCPPSLPCCPGGSACASCKPTAVSQPHALAPGLFECLDSVTDDLNCAKGGGFKDGTGCTRCDPEYYLDTRKNVTMERSAVAAAAALPLAVCSSCSGDFNCKNCTANGCAACDAPDSWNSDGAFLPAGSPRCESCQRFGHCSACSEAKGCELGTCAKGYSETTFNGVTTSCVFKTRCHATEFPNSGGDPGACLWDWARALMGCTQAQCTLGTGCTSCPKNKVVVRTCPRLQSCIGEKTLGCAPRATKANVGCESCPARSVRMPLMSSARTSWACVSCKKLGCPAGKCQVRGRTGLGTGSSELYLKGGHAVAALCHSGTPLSTLSLLLRRTASGAPPAPRAATPTAHRASLWRARAPPRSCPGPAATAPRTSSVQRWVAGGQRWAGGAWTS